MNPVDSYQTLVDEGMSEAQAAVVARAFEYRDDLAQDIKDSFRQELTGFQQETRQDQADLRIGLETMKGWFLKWMLLPVCLAIVLDSVQSLLSGIQTLCPRDRSRILSSIRLRARLS